jgi:ABC-type uncharacterized transport system ATPase subunit
LTKAFDRLFDTGRVFYFIGDTGSNKADIDALFRNMKSFLMGNPENKKMRDLSKGNQKKVGIMRPGNPEVVFLTSLC